jgi:uncharacterized protein YcsI (UPF0317 family)
MAALKVRHLARANKLTTPTTGLAPGFVQANLIVLSAAVAADFELLAIRNPVSCPLLGKSTRSGDAHSFAPMGLFQDSVDPQDIIDIRNDIAHYNVYEGGQLVATKNNIDNEWSADSVAFLIGCSFSFETALSQAGLTPRQIELGSNVPMYKTAVKLQPAGVFVGGQQVVSMRPYRPEDIEKVRNITRPYVRTHGEPVAWGWEALEELGISDIDKPDFGSPTLFRDGEVPVFWVSRTVPSVPQLLTT